jgi:S1-C subfamily serine protease
MKRYIALKSAPALLLISLCGWTTEAQEDRAALIERIRPAVVAVTVYNDDDEIVDQISGFFISKEGNLLSCRHVLRGASRAEVKTREGKVYAIRLVTAEDPDLDLVQLLIDLPDAEVPYLRMTDVNATRDEQVTAVGHQHIVQGFVSYVRIRLESGRTFPFSAATAARATGGPVINKKGEVIAIATEQDVGDQSVTLAIASSSALALFPGRTETLADWNARIKVEPKHSSEVYFSPGWISPKRRP